MRYFFSIYIFCVVATVVILGFRGDKSAKPPLRIFPDMDEQPKYHPQGTSSYFRNNMADRPVPANTVVRGQLWEAKQVFSPDFDTDRFHNLPLYQGRNEEGGWAEEFPVVITHAAMERGRLKWDIHCAVCHGTAGDGRGITSRYGINATNLTTQTYRDMAGGEIFNTITHGKGLMYGLGERIEPEDRWNIILYLRALQRVRNATVDDLPEAERRRLGQ